MKQSPPSLGFPSFHASPSSSNSMAHHPSSTSSQKARRLYELLEEKQEPFFLDIYVSEKGYSTRFLDEAPIMGWPGNEKRTLYKFTSNQFRRKRREWFLKRTLLSKLQPKHAKRALLYRNNTIRRRHEFENSEIFCENKMHKLKQLSPVSVLDFDSYGSSPASQSEEEKSQDNLILDPKIVDIFNQFLERAYTPEFEKTLKPLDQDYPKRKPQSSIIRDIQERNWDCGGQIWRSEEKNEALFVQKKELDSVENHITEFEKLIKKICKEVSEAPNWSDFSSEIRGIAMEIEDAILDDIVSSLCSCTL